MTDMQAMIAAQEGTGPMRGDRFLPYQDTKGLWTIAWGRNLSDNGISREEARMLLNADIADAIDTVRRVCSIYDQLSRPRQLVMVSMAYNLGLNRLSKFVHFLNAIHREDWDEAADEILNSKAARDDAPGRYKELARMMRQDVSQWI